MEEFTIKIGIGEAILRLLCDPSEDEIKAFREDMTEIGADEVDWLQMDVTEFLKLKEVFRAAHDLN
jgi:hypothetical protein